MSDSKFAWFLLVQKRERRMREKLARAHDETLDDQEVELLDENIQPCRDDMVSATWSSAALQVVCEHVHKLCQPWPQDYEAILVSRNFKSL